MKNKKASKLNDIKMDKMKGCKKKNNLTKPQKSHCTKNETNVNKEADYLKDQIYEQLNENANTELRKNVNTKLNDNTNIELSENVYENVNENVLEELNDNASDFILKKKIYDKNIAEIEKKIQTNKLNKLLKTKETILDMLKIIKNRKLNSY